MESYNCIHKIIWTLNSLEPCIFLIVLIVQVLIFLRHIKSEVAKSKSAANKFDGQKMHLVGYPKDIPVHILNICVACVYICYKQVYTRVLFPKPWPKESYIMCFFLLDVYNLQPRIVIELNILSYNTLKPSTNSLNFLYLHLHVI